MYNIVNQDKKKQISSKTTKKDKLCVNGEKNNHECIKTELLREEKTKFSENNMESIYEEYEELSYKKSSSTPVKENTQEPRKRSSGEKDKDFRAKYKTEKCKYFESNKECKFGTSVFLLLFFLVCICPWK